MINIIGYLLLAFGLGVLLLPLWGGLLTAIVMGLAAEKRCTMTDEEKDEIVRLISGEGTGID